MSHTIIVRLSLMVLLLLPAWSMAADDPPASTPGLTRAVEIAIPSRPIATREQLDAYIRTTPAEKSPLNWLTPAGQQRFLASIIFSERAVGGFSTEDLRYDLTRAQAYRLLQLFGSESYAINMDARSAPRPASPDTGSQLEKNYAALIVATDTGDSQAAANLYQTDFAPLQTDAQRRALGPVDMDLLFRATNRAASVAPPPAHLADLLTDLKADFDELERRHAVDRPQASDYYNTLQRARQNEQARALLAAHPQLERDSMPSLRLGSRIHKGQPSLWVPNANRRELVRFRFNIQAPSQIIVLGSTSCRYCINAARSLEADPILRDIFRDYAQWVATSADITDFDAVREWNRTYQDMRLGISYDDRELPMVEQFNTPTFFFLDHGSVVDTVFGWPDAGNLDAIRRGLRQIDLMR